MSWDCRNSLFTLFGLTLVLESLSSSACWCDEVWPLLTFVVSDRLSPYS